MTGMPWKLNMPLAALCAPPVLWVLFFVHYPLLPLPVPAQWAVFGVLFVAGWFLLRGVSVELCVDAGDLKALVVIAAVLLFAHAGGLFLALGGDELYHAEMSTFNLKHVRDAVERWAPLSGEAYHSSMWRLLDLRHVMVSDIAAVFSGLSWIVSFVWVAAFAALRERPAGRAFLVWGTLALLACLGMAFGFSEGLAHPPLRLFPWFVSTLCFGLNEFAFRFPALLASLAVAFLSYRSLRRHVDGPCSWQLAVAFGLLIAFVPVAYYVGEAVEPSVFGWGAWMATLLFCLRALEKEEQDSERWLLFAGTAVAFGSVIRQPVATAWLAVIATAIALSLAGRLRVRPLFATRLFFLGLLLVPYLLTTSKLGHAAADPTGRPLLDRWAAALGSGAAVMTTINSTTLPWALTGLAALPLALVVGRWRLALLLLCALSPWALYFSICDYLWGVGRYQAEYVAPFLSLVFFFAFSALRSTATRIFAVVTVALLAFCSWNANQRVNDDTNYNLWPRMRITTTAYVPMREALSCLRREEAEGHFVIIGGQPWNGDMALWLAGHSLTETRTWRRLQHEIRATVGDPTHLSPEELYARLRGAGVTWMAVEGGTKRERQHRDSWTAAIISLVERSWNNSPSVLERKVYEDARGGRMDLYRFR